MKLIDFINKYCGKKVDFDGAYGAQCVDLFRQYCRDVLEVEHQVKPVNGAIDIFNNYDDDENAQNEFAKFNVNSECDGYKVYNYASDNIRIGYVLFFDKTPTNKYGHVAICVGRDPVGDFIVFEQDGFLQNGAKLSVKRKETVIGAFKPLHNGRVHKCIVRERTEVIKGDG